MIPNGIEVPAEAVEPDDPPHVLYAGRLSAEKGVRELVAATQGLPLVVAGDGPLRDEVPGRSGWSRTTSSSDCTDGRPSSRARHAARASACACLEAMAAGRPVVASAVGGLRDLVVDGETGLLVPPGDVPALRAALERLLGDAELRARLGRAARERVLAEFTWKRYAEEIRRAYDEARQ